MLFIPIFWFVYIYQFIFPTCSRTFAKLWISWKRLVSLWKYYHSINVENGGTESRVNLYHLKQNLRLLFKKNCCDNLIFQVITIRCLKMQGFVFISSCYTMKHWSNETQLLLSFKELLWETQKYQQNGIRYWFEIIFCIYFNTDHAAQLKKSI